MLGIVIVFSWFQNLTDSDQRSGETNGEVMAIGAFSEEVCRCFNVLVVINLKRGLLFRVHTGHLIH